MAGPGNTVAWIDEAAKLQAVAPDEIAGDTTLVAEAMERLRPQAEAVDAGTLDYDEFGKDHLQTLRDDPEVAAANARVEAFTREHCAEPG